jgi:HK97 family phage major capsid protein
VSESELRGRIDEIVARIGEIGRQYHGRRLPDGIRDEWNRLNAERDEATATLNELRIRRERIAALASDPASTERVGTGQAPGQVHRANPWANPWAEQVHPIGFDPAHMRDRALAVVDHYSTRNVLSSEAADRVDQILRDKDPTGDTAAYLVAAGNPAYATAFAKMLGDPIMGHNRFSAEEVEAVRQVTQVQIRNAALQEDTGTGGQYAIPISLDPTVLLTSAGALCPIRQYATVETIGTRSWTGVASSGVTAGYVAELTPATDASPTLSQPAITTQQGRAFVQASIEVFQDWDRIRSEMVRILDDARNVTDATAFLTGFTNSPVGVLAIGFTGGLSTTQRVLSAATNSYAVGDPWLLKAQIPPRFINNATFASAPGIWDTTYRFVGGNSAEPLQMPSRGGDMMGRPKFEWSTMTNGTVTGARLMIGGDFASGYRILDRLGSTAEIVPHVMTTTGLPSGARGIYYRWHTGAAVVNANAFRYLEIK